jgi:beta-hydroxylase
MKKCWLILLIILSILFYSIANIDNVLLLTNPVCKYTSLIGNEPFYNNSILETTQILQKHWKAFRDEALSTYKSYTTIKGDQYFNDIVDDENKWKKLYIRWHSDIDPIARKKCPESCKIIENLPGVKIAMFSVLSPGAYIKPHKGPYKGCLRYHLGLSTPNSDDCYIVVDNIKYSWKDGEGIIIDDTYTHWVKNDTDKTRIILFCDIVRPMNLVGSIMNTLIMNTFGKLTTRGN